MNYKLKKISGDASFREFYRIQKNTKSSIIVLAKKNKYKNLLVYSAVNEILKKNNLEVKKIVSQSEFLQKLGIIERANILSKKASFKEKSDLFFRLRKLLHYKEMGNLFKVMFAQKKDGKFSLGF